MSYYYNRIVEGSFEEVIEKVTLALKEEGFGVLTDIDFSGTLKSKIDVDIPKYRILGACNPKYAYVAYQQENKIGVMLPCNVIVQEVEKGVEVSAVDPIASMQAIGNSNLESLANEVKLKLNSAIDLI